MTGRRRYGLLRRHYTRRKGFTRVVAKYAVNRNTSVVHVPAHTLGGKGRRIGMAINTIDCCRYMRSWFGNRRHALECLTIMAIDTTCGITIGRVQRRGHLATRKRLSTQVARITSHPGFDRDVIGRRRHRLLVCRKGLSSVTSRAIPLRNDRAAMVHLPGRKCLCTQMARRAIKRRKYRDMGSGGHLHGSHPGKCLAGVAALASRDNTVVAHAAERKAGGRRVAVITVLTRRNMRFRRDRLRHRHNTGRECLVIMAIRTGCRTDPRMVHRPGRKPTRHSLTLMTNVTLCRG